MLNEKLLRAIEEVLNPHGFTFGPLNAEVGTLPIEGVSYIRVDGELISVKPLKLCVVPFYPHQIGKSFRTGNAVLIEADWLEGVVKEWYEGQGAICDGFRLSSCQPGLTQKLTQCAWSWSAWPEKQSTLVTHSHGQLTELLNLLASASINSYHCTYRSFQDSEWLPEIFSSLLHVDDIAGISQNYDIQQLVWHLCGQQVIMRLQGKFRVLQHTLFLEPGIITSWYDTAECSLNVCPACGCKLSTDQIRLISPW